MNEVFLKYLTAPTITSGGNPPAFSMTPDGKLTAKNADISGSVNANAGTLDGYGCDNENCQIKGKLSANQIEGDIVETVGKASPRGTPGHRSGGHQGPLPSGFMTIGRLTGRLLFRRWHSTVLNPESILIFTPHAA